MGHACEILTFKEKDYTKKQIQKECDDWGSYNADAYERGYFNGGLGSNVYFTDKVFNTRQEAFKYLDSTFGRYAQTAVRYKEPKEGKIAPSQDKFYKTKQILDLERRIQEYTQRVAALDEPHYAKVTTQTVKCKCCGAVLPTQYCGSVYINNCPFCKTDLRPATTLEKRAKYVATYNELLQKYNMLCAEADAKYKEALAKYYNNAPRSFDLYWAVACEVHC